MDKKVLRLAKKITISVHHVDLFERLKPSAVLQFFQDIATEHAENLGIGFESLKLNHESFWVVSRISYRVLKYPVLGQELDIITYPKKPNKIDVDRDYIIKDSSGETLIVGSSKWCIIDINSRRLKRCDAVFTFSENDYLSDIIIEDANKRVMPLDEKELEKCSDNEFKVFNTDLDRNLHMNNTRYADAVINTCSIEKLSNNTIMRFDINYVAELKAGDKYKVSMLDKGNISCFEAINLNSKKDVFRAVIEWAEKND